MKFFDSGSPETGEAIEYLAGDSYIAFSDHSNEQPDIVNVYVRPSKRTKRAEILNVYTPVEFTRKPTEILDVDTPIESKRKRSIDKAKIERLAQRRRLVSRYGAHCDKLEPSEIEALYAQELEKSKVQHSELGQFESKRHGFAGSVVTFTDNSPVSGADKPMRRISPLPMAIRTIRTNETLRFLEESYVQRTGQSVNKSVESLLESLGGAVIRIGVNAAVNGLLVGHGVPGLLAQPISNVIGKQISELAIGPEGSRERAIGTVLSIGNKLHGAGHG